MGEKDVGQLEVGSVMVIGSDFGVSELARKLALEITESKMGFTQAYTYILEEFGFDEPGCLND